METSNQSTGTDSTSTPWLDDIKKLTEKFQLPGVDVAALVDWQRKDMETLVEANRQAYEGVRALIERRNEILQETLAQWQAAVKDATSSEAIAKQAEAGRTTGDREYSRTRRDGSAVAQQRLEGRAGPYAGESGQFAEVAAAEVARGRRDRHPRV